MQQENRRVCVCVCVQKSNRKVKFSASPDSEWSDDTDESQRRTWNTHTHGWSCDLSAEMPLRVESVKRKQRENVKYLHVIWHWFKVKTCFYLWICVWCESFLRSFLKFIFVFNIYTGKVRLNIFANIIQWHRAYNNVIIISVYLTLTKICHGCTYIWSFPLIVRR